MPVTLRPPKPHELPALSALCLRSKAHWGYDAAFLDACRAELTLTDTDLAQTALCLAERDGRLAAVAQVTRGQTPADLLKLFVDPPFIGQGLGKRLLRWAASEVRAQGARTLAIEADPGAVPFYQAMGARQTGIAPSGSVPGRFLPLLQLDL